MQRKGDAYTFVFASVICVFCAVVLALAATALKPIQEKNVKLDVTVNILGAVGHDPMELKKTPDKAFELFEKEFEIKILDKDNAEQDRKFMETELAKLGYVPDELQDLDLGTLVRRFDSKVGLLAARAGQKRAEYDPGYKLVYVHRGETGGVDAYVVPIEGYGLWDIIKGYLALETDLNTIKGVTFYEHKETPGLGARVTEAWFQESFKGKKILDENNNLVSITVAKGPTASGPHQVDGISGATLTGDGMNVFMKRDLETYEPYFQTLRSSSRSATR
ncbi:MAG: NADH:ubiquinone reductase (Na(+)-transporting) subunit C [Acidobacteriota bacterium]|nr:NADH:ubiquinone reductase (Na(+)-transporting) subunit C [Acidobacteriota bacterium]